MQKLRRYLEEYINGPAYLSGVKCSGSEEKLTTCSNGGTGVPVLESHVERVQVRAQYYGCLYISTSIMFNRCEYGAWMSQVP